MNTGFDHEKLTVYQEVVRFVAWADEILKTLPKGLAVHGQLDRASTSIPLNIADGNGKYTAPDRCRFFDSGSKSPHSSCWIEAVEERGAGKRVLPGVSVNNFFLRGAFLIA